MHAYLIPALRNGPKAIQRLLHLIAKDKLDLALEEGRFTPREIIAHLAEWEPIFLERMHDAVTNPGCTVHGVDEGEMAKLHRYDLSEVDEQIILFLKDREKCIAFIESLTPDQLRLTFTHSERGEMSVDDHANLMVGHDVYHIEQLTAYLP